MLLRGHGRHRFVRDIRRRNRSCRILRGDVHRNDCNSNGRDSHIPLGDVHREEDCVRLDDRNSNGRGSHIPLGERTMQRYFRSDESDNADP